MSEALRCYRCGLYIDVKTVTSKVDTGWRRLQTPPLLVKPYVYDLCPACWRSWLAWLGTPGDA